MTLREARKIFGDSQRACGEQLKYGKGAQVRVCNIERGTEHPGGAVQELIAKYIRQAELFKSKNCCAQCPKCGWWTVTTTGRTKDDGDYSEMLCNDCGNVWFAVI